MSHRASGLGRHSGPRPLFEHRIHPSSISRPRSPMTQQLHPGVDSDAVLDAAASCYLRFGVAKTTATDIAQVVGISRATLYRRFGSHEAIFLTVLARESTAMAADAELHLAEVDDPVERILEGMMFAIEE